MPPAAPSAAPHSCARNSVVMPSTALGFPSVFLGLRRHVDRVLPPQPPLDRHTRWGIGLVVAAGAVARVSWAIGDSWRPKSIRDPGLYLILSQMLADGRGYRYP